MEICCSGVYTFPVTLVLEQVQCPESMNRNTFPCYHPDPEPYSPRSLLSHTHRRVNSLNPGIKPFSTSQRQTEALGVQAERQKHRKRVSHSSVQRAVFSLLEVACSLDAFCPASGPVFLPLLLLPRSIFLTLAPSLPLVHPHHSPASLLFSLSTHFSSRRLRIPACPSERSV